MSRRPFESPRLVAATLIVATVLLMMMADLASHLRFALLILAGCFVVLSAADGQLEHRLVSPRLLLGTAALLRLALLPVAPTLSDDVLRYVWDGRVVTAGFDPYQLPPDSPALESLRDELWHSLPHRDVPTVYPPLAQTLFSIVARQPKPILAWKLIVSLADLLTCALLLRLARVWGAPAGRVAWYAWNPLVVLETAGMGHVDAIGVTAVVAVVLFSVRRRSGLAACGAAAGVLLKLVPVAGWPLWARTSGRPWRFLGIAIGITTLALFPVVLASGGVPPGLTRYAVSWEFNGPLYEPLWRLIDAVDPGELIKQVLDRVKLWTGFHEPFNRLYPFVYPQFLAKLLLLSTVATTALWRSLAAADPVSGTGRLFAGLLLASATLYPWYLLWVLPFAALCRHRAWRLASATVLLSYLPQFDSIALFPWIHLLEWGVVLIWATKERWRTA